MISPMLYSLALGWRASQGAEPSPEMAPSTTLGSQFHADMTWL